MSISKNLIILEDVDYTLYVGGDYTEEHSNMEAYGWVEPGSPLDDGEVGNDIADDIRHQNFLYLFNNSSPPCTPW